MSSKQQMRASKFTFIFIFVLSIDVLQHALAEHSASFPLVLQHTLETALETGYA